MNRQRRMPKVWPKKVTSSQLLDRDINDLIQRYDELDDESIENFDDVPLSDNTLQGLNDAGYTKLSLIQKKAIPLALRGQDVLGAAKTGSGKTLAFVIPVLELLFRLKWTNLEGLAALILSPTRELAYQTFNVIKKVGRYHDFSCGLVIGGKNFQEETDAIGRTNILICTPGRLLQHMDETWSFHPDSLKILVLDEADRILDLGFAQTMKAILNNLPRDRQTLLFSATQTKSVSSLVSLSLRDPIFVSAHENAPIVTPDQLEQFYVVCDEMEKVNFMWSFVKNHKEKILVFLQCCKQAKFYGLLFKKLRPGIPVMSIYGRMGQTKRVMVFDNFCEKGHGVMFATDLASRGLDIPEVDWVIQLDCCPDVETYIHRVGRTARFERNGRSILVLRPQELHIVKELRGRNVPISKIEVNEDMLFDINQRVQIEVASDGDLLEDAKRAVVLYVKSLKKLNRKDIFDVELIDIEKLARSYGIPKTPRVRFLRRSELHGDSVEVTTKNMSSEREPKETDRSMVDGSTDEDDVELADAAEGTEGSENIVNEQGGGENLACPEIGDVREHESFGDNQATVGSIDPPDFDPFKTALRDIGIFGKPQHARFNERLRMQSRMARWAAREEARQARAARAENMQREVRLALSDDE